MYNTTYSSNSNDEAALILLGRLTVVLPQLEVDLPLQLEIKKTIDEVLYKYEVRTKETALVTSDMHQKIQLFIACKKLEGLSKKTLYNYSCNLRKLDEFFNKPVSTVTAMDIRMFLAQYGQGKQENSMNTFMISVRLFFQWLQDEEYIISNPTKRIKPIKEPKRMRTPLNEEQIELLRDKITEPRDKALFEFLISTGCRVSEVSNVKVSDIDWTSRSLKVIGKGNKERKVYFTERCKRALINYLGVKKGEDEHLFVGSRFPFSHLGTRGIQVIIRKMKERSGITVKLHPHIFRHTFATQALNSGMPIEVVQKLLGHEQASTTQIYAKLQERNVEHMYRRLIS